MLKGLNYFLLAAISGLLLLPSHASQADSQSVLELLHQPGVHAIMRHAIAPGTGDPSTFALDDCTTQRNLDGRGRAQAQAIGEAFRDAGIAFDRVLTSQWCRCRETAQLLELGEPADFPALNSFFQDRSTRDQQTDQLQAFLGSLSESESVLFVTHQVNITALTGRGVASGEVFLIRLNERNEVEVVGELLIHP